MTPDAAIDQPAPSRRWLQILKICAVGRHPRRTLARIIVLAAACFIVFGFILLPVRVTGISMEPTYHNGAIRFSNRLAFLWHEPQRRDVVTIRYAGIHAMLMKRIIGLPGETVQFVRGQALIDGAPLDEPYVSWGCRWNLHPIKLGDGDYFVVGDNRSMRMQDHEFGKTRREKIVGKIVL